MKKRGFFQFSLYLWFLMVFLIGCSQFSRKSRPPFQSDEQLIKRFEENQSEMLSVMQRCEAEQESKGLKRNVRDPFYDCDVDESVLESLNLKEVAVAFQQSTVPPASLNDPGGKRTLFQTDYYINDKTDTFVEEKGYVYSPAPLQHNIIEGSLDQFSGQVLVHRQGALQEVWRYKQIEPDWYLYFRQYYYPFLG